MYYHICKRFLTQREALELSPHIPLVAQIPFKIVGLCYGTLPSRRGAATLRDRRSPAGLLYSEAGEGRRLRREHASVPCSSRELDPGTSGNLQTRTVPA